MSIKTLTLYEMRCDSCGKVFEELELQGTPRVDANFINSIKECAKNQGWIFIDNDHYCSDCADNVF